MVVHIFYSYIIISNDKQIINSLIYFMDNETQDAVITNKKKFGAKPIIYILIIVIIVAVGLYFSRGMIAATVDGSPITKSTLNKKLEKQFGKEVLDALIIEKLVEKAAEEKNITVNDEDVNTEIQNIENQLAAQDTTLEQALQTQGLTVKDLKDQIILQKKLELLLAGEINVTDDEVNKFITDNNLTIPAENPDAFIAQVRQQLNQQKINTRAQDWINEQKSNAKIKYYTEF